MMSHAEFAEHLAALRLPLSEAAILLGVSERSVRRWSEEGVPGPAAAAVRAWRSLDERHLPWKPNSIPALMAEEDQLQRMRQHDDLLNQVMREVESRGGPANPWTVDLEMGRAKFGNAEVGFYWLDGGGFSPSTYRRLDRGPSDSDKPEIQDAVYCIAKAFARARAASAPLSEVAVYIRKYDEFFVSKGPEMMTPVARARQRLAILNQADRLDRLAQSAAEGRATYRQFEDILSELHRLGFYPETSLVSSVARAMVG